MHTIMRDRHGNRSDFVFYSDRIIRLVVEHGLGHLPFNEQIVTTPTGDQYKGAAQRYQTWSKCNRRAIQTCLTERDERVWLKKGLNDA